MQEFINRLKEQLTGCQQLVQLDQAVIAAILEKTGAVEVTRADIRRLLEEKRQVRAAYDAETGVYRLWTEGGVDV